MAGVYQMMKDILPLFKEALLNLWQLPQHLLGVILFAIYKGKTEKGEWLVDETIKEGLAKGILVRTSPKMKGGISLGDFVIVSETASKRTIAHEMGHSKQSRILGPLYLLVIGLPSAMKASVHSATHCKYGDNRFYYKFYTEKWADKIAGIKRTFYN